LFCTQCGQEIPEQARFCGHCGAPVAVRAAAELAGELAERQSEWPANPADRQEPAAAPNPIDDPDEEVRAFVQRNADYYLRKWSKTPDPGKGIGWNWAAFFLPYFWLGYRKQYVALFRAGSPMAGDRHRGFCRRSGDEQWKYRALYFGRMRNQRQLVVLQVRDPANRESQSTADGLGSTRQA
jgi:Protein of unknown function (DUF2628).